MFSTNNRLEFMTFALAPGPTTCTDICTRGFTMNNLPSIYYPPRDVFALNTGKYRPGCIIFVYTGAPVLWIMSGNNFRFFNNISESM